MNTRFRCVRSSVLLFLLVALSFSPDILNGAGQIALWCREQLQLKFRLGLGIQMGVWFLTRAERTVQIFSKFLS